MGASAPLAGSSINDSGPTNVGNFQPLPFITHDQTGPILRNLQRTVWAGDIATVSGERGTGKWRLLKHLPIWLSEQTTSLRPSQIIVLNLEPTWRNTMHDTKVLSPTTLLTFGLLWHELQSLMLQPYVRRQQSGNGDIKLYTDREFFRLLHKVQLFLQEHATLAIAINRAEHLDTHTLEWLMHLRRIREEQLALIFCGRLAPNETSNTPWAKIFPSVLGQGWQNCVVQNCLLPMNEEEVRTKVFAKVLKSLNATLSADLRRRHEHLTAQFWVQTAGNWHSINALAKKFALELLSDSRSPRLVTTEMAARVLGNEGFK